MKVLIAGGDKVTNIVKMLEKKFSNGGIDFIAVKHIDEIEDIFVRGEYYDRAIIIEQCWNNDFEETDTMVIRNRINEFAKRALGRQTHGISYVFFTQTEDSAAQVYDEILPIINDSVVIHKEPPYSVNFFASLVTSDIDNINSSIVYEPEYEMPEMDLRTTVTEKVIDNTVNYTVEEVDDISKELFETDEISAPGFTGFDLGVDFEREVGSVEEPEVEEVETKDDIWDTVMDGLDGLDDFDDIEVEDEEPMKPSLDLPDFSQGIHNDTGFGDDYSFDDFDQSISSDENQLVPDIVNDIEVESNSVEENQGVSEIEDTMFMGGIIDDIDTNDTDVSSIFNDEDYIEEKPKTEQSEVKLDMDAEQIKVTLDAFANRGNSIVVTGSGGCGTSTVAYHLANTVCNLGYSVLLVDMDTEGRAQSYISKDNYSCMESDGANLMQALKSTAGINSHVAIVKPGFRLLTMGIGGNMIPLEDIIQKEKLIRFIQLSKTNYNFIIYDVPFKHTVGCVKDLAFMTDNLVIVTDSSDWGLTKTMLSVCNVEGEDTQDIIFSKGQLLFNRYKELKSVMGKKIKSSTGICQAIDSKIAELLGDEPEYGFSDFHICGVIPENENLKSSWYSTEQYTDSSTGYKEFTELLISILLKK